MRLSYSVQGFLWLGHILGCPAPGGAIAGLGFHDRVCMVEVFFRYGTRRSALFAGSPATFRETRGCNAAPPFITVSHNILYGIDEAIK